MALDITIPSPRASANSVRRHQFGRRMKVNPLAGLIRFCLREFVSGVGSDDELRSGPRGLDLPRCLAV
jgi:hypothetical protein